MDEGSVLVLKRFAVVKIEGPLCFSVRADHYHKREWIPAHKAAASSWAIAARDDVAGAHEEGDFIQRGGDRDRLTCAGVDGIVEIVKIGFARGKVHFDDFGGLSDNWFGEQARAANIELIIDCEGRLIAWVNIVMRAKDGDTGDGGFVEGRVPGWEKLVPEPQCLCDDTSVWFTCKVRFAATGVDVCVAAHERVEDSGLEPAGEEFFARVAEKATDVGACKREAGDIAGENHGNSRREMGPNGLVISRPHSAHALRADKEGASKDEGAARRFRIPVEERGVGGVDKGKAVKIVEIAMLPIFMMEIVFWHGGFGTIEDRRFVHIVPNKGIRGRTSERRVGEKASPPFDGGGIEAVNPMG